METVYGYLSHWPITEESLDILNKQKAVREINIKQGLSL